MELSHEGQCNRAEFSLNKRGNTFQTLLLFV
jgi:hypothetical protein